MARSKRQQDDNIEPDGLCFDFDAVSQIEAAFRKQLERRPEDCVLRLRLAWFLLLEAAHQAGLDDLGFAVVGLTDEGTTRKSSAIKDRSQRARTARLLRESLKQAVTVRQLSADPKVLLLAEHLCMLAKDAGAACAVARAEADVDRVLKELTRVVQDDG